MWQTWLKCCFIEQETFLSQCFSPLRDYKWVPADLQETRLIVGWDDPISGIPFGGRGGVEGQASRQVVTYTTCRKSSGRMGHATLIIR